MYYCSKPTTRQCYPILGILWTFDHTTKKSSMYLENSTGTVPLHTAGWMLGGSRDKIPRTQIVSASDQRWCPTEGKVEKCPMDVDVS